MNEPSKQTTPILSSKLYDRLKFVAQYVLPALATFMLTLGEIWNIPNAQEIAATITAVDFFLGALVGVSHNQYMNSEARFDGAVTTIETDQGTAVRLNVDPVDLIEKDEVLLKVHEENELST